MSLERASWLSVAAACAIGAVIMLIEGYVGYPIVLAAVGLSAAVNLL